MHKAWVYILQCSDGSYYTGHTTDLRARVARHQAGLASRYTRGRLPVRLVFSQEFPDAHEAFLRERQVKGWRRKKKQALIQGDFEARVQLSQSEK